ncbi:MAG: hypothetical protein QOG85_1698 [Gaiellaceae bacterium]|jgi:hypothetical protein|nr:hypothetical protein [Gaiellaceae bacterium]
MTDDLLTNFRSEMPMPDEETTQRIYERATSGRRRLATRNRLVAVAAVMALAGLAAGLSLTLGGGSSPKPWVIGPAGGGPAGKISLNPLTTEFTADGNAYSSIDASLLSIDNATAVELRVVRSDAADVADADSAASTVVFDDQASMADDGNPEDGSYTTWSGTLTPNEWDGGCQQALYRIEYHIGDSDLYGSSGWFQCSGPKVDAGNPFLY